jgi:hypothetical protein
MSESFSLGPYEKEIREELVRIGLGQGGVNIGGPFTAAQLLEALRMTPDHAGGRALLASLETVIRRSSGE